MIFLLSSTWSNRCALMKRRKSNGQLMTTLWKEMGHRHQGSSSCSTASRSQKKRYCRWTPSEFQSCTSPLQVKKALDYYRGTKKGTRSLPAMTTKFSWIHTENHMNKLREFERRGSNFRIFPTNMTSISYFR